MKLLVQILVLTIFFFSCGTKEKKQIDQKPDKVPAEQNKQEDVWTGIVPSILKIDTYDGERILESGQGFFVAEDLVVTKYSLVSHATKAIVTPFDENKKYTFTEFVAIDRINDLILLKANGLKRPPLELYTGVAPNTAKTMYVSPNLEKTIQLFTGKLLNLATVQGTKRYRITNRVRKATFGMPIFVSNRKVLGLAFSANVDYKMQSYAIPSTYIASLIQKRKNKPATLASLRTISNSKIAAENMKIKGLVLKTDVGNITVRLFNETPEYRDNFIKLVKEDYYDSLLIHRVISDFGIQSGAADTRYAGKGDNVGWKGPGYTLPAHFSPKLYHKRGMIGSPRKPETRNQRRRSDGSQFYIISGRKYVDRELDELEEENNYKFTSEQRKIYKTVGGSPHLDGTYTVFGEVTSGMDIVDKIVKVETDDRWRPLEDIRLIEITIMK